MKNCFCASFGAKIYAALSTGIKFLVLAFLMAFLFSCEESTFEDGKKGYQTKNVIIVVIDGPRYQDTWGDGSLTRIPVMDQVLRPQGTLFTNFYNDGYTYTASGHAAITTGFRQPIENGGKEYPQKPSIFQYWLKHTGKPNTAAWIITSKGKLN